MLYGDLDLKPIFVAIALLLVSIQGVASPSSTGKAIKPVVSVQSTNPTEPPPGATPVRQDEAVERKLLEAQIDNLKEQKEIVESYHESILDTVYFSVGSVFTLTILLLGYSWWFNTRTYEKEKVALKDEIKLLIKSTSDEIKVEQQTKRTEQDNQFATRIDAITNSSATNYAQIRTDMADQNRTISSQLAMNKLQTDWLLREFRMVEEMVWGLRGVKSNSLFSIAQALSLSAGDEEDTLFDQIFERFEERANEMINSKDAISDGMREQIKKQIEKCMEKRQDKANEALALLDQVAKKD